jgi:hypothetical protein
VEGKVKNPGEYSYSEDLPFVRGFDFAWFELALGLISWALNALIDMGV